LINNSIETILSMEKQKLTVMKEIIRIQSIYINKNTINNFIKISNKEKCHKDIKIAIIDSIVSLLNNP